jgi:hypothetical protein
MGKNFERSSLNRNRTNEKVRELLLSPPKPPIDEAIEVQI